MKITVILAISLLPLCAAPVTKERIDQLSSNKNAWEKYLERSAELARLNEEELQKELKAAGLTEALSSPSGGDFKLSHKPGDSWFSSDKAQTLVPIILSYQTPAGGWSKKGGYSKGARKPGMLFSSQYQPGKKTHYLGTFDNRSTTEQVIFLAAVAEATKNKELHAPVIRGIQYMLDAQYPNGGFPQVYPLEGGYHDDITMNDDVYLHIVSLLADAAGGKSPFTFLDSTMRKKCEQATKLALDLLLKLQKDRKQPAAIWCGQYDALTQDPDHARGMEPISYASVESSQILKWLMSRESKEAQEIAAIESALKWFDAHKMTGFKYEDDTLTPDSNASEPLWARFYDIESNKAIYPGRDGVIYDDFNQMAEKNELGYDFISSRPFSVISNGQKKWRKALTK